MMSATKRGLRVVIAVAALGGLGGAFAVAGCNDEKKPPLTPDGPEMTTPMGDSVDAGAVPAPATTSAAPAH